MAILPSPREAVDAVPSIRGAVSGYVASKARRNDRFAWFGIWSLIVVAAFVPDELEFPKSSADVELYLDVSDIVIVSGS